MLRDLPIIGGFYKDPNRHWSAQDTLNVLPVPAERPGSETQWASVDVPGMKPFVQIGLYAPETP